MLCALTRLTLSGCVSSHSALVCHNAFVNVTLLTLILEILYWHWLLHSFPLILWHSLFLSTTPSVSIPWIRVICYVKDHFVTYKINWSIYHSCQCLNCKSDYCVTSGDSQIFYIHSLMHSFNSFLNPLSKHVKQKTLHKIGMKYSCEWPFSSFWDSVINSSAFKTNAVQNWAVSRTDVLIIFFTPEKCNL